MIFFLIYTSKFISGVTAVKIDMEEHRAIVGGKFKVEKLLKKLKKKTGKKAEIMQIEEEDQGQENYEGNNNNDHNHNEFLGANCYENFHHENQALNQDCNMLDGFGDEYILNDITLFSDENINACVIL